MLLFIYYATQVVFINVTSGVTLSHGVKVTVCTPCVALRLKITEILIMSYYLSWMSL